MANTILLALAPVFFVMALGYGAGRFGIVENHHVDGFNTLVMSFALPASLFAATASAPRGELLVQVPLFAIFGGVMLLVYFAWYSIARRFLATGKVGASVQALTVAFPNLGGVGLPIASALLGPTGPISVAVAMAAGSILVSPITLVVAEMGRLKEEGAVKTPGARMFDALRRALTKPIVLGPALGILLSLCSLTLNPVIEACLTVIGQAAAGVALFLTGLILSAQSFEFNWKIVGATALADIARPLLTVAVVFLLPVPFEIARTAILFAAVPAGFFGILFAVSYRLDSSTVGSMVIGSTIVSIVTMAIAIAVMFP
ncbi:AEC family transporter [Mesorhizobium calcicola]|uniref:AEC family transporter n=1 Tax=Mesorhizobium calcicola TaxID=1300310 RepID=A0ABW4WGB3_9HYPH